MAFAEGPLESRACVHDRLQIRGQWLCFLGASQPQEEMGHTELRAKGLTSEWDSLFLSPVSPRHQPSGFCLAGPIQSLQENNLPLEFFAPAMKCIPLPSPPLAIHSDLGMSANTQHREAL